MMCHLATSAQILRIGVFSTCQKQVNRKTICVAEVIRSCTISAYWVRSAWKHVYGRGILKLWRVWDLVVQCMVKAI